MLHVSVFCQMRRCFVVEAGLNQSVQRLPLAELRIETFTELAIPTGSEIACLRFAVEAIHGEFFSLNSRLIYFR